MQTTAPRNRVGSPTYDELEAELRKPVVTWGPHKDSDHPDALIGQVLDRYQKVSDFKNTDGTTTTYPVLVVEDERHPNAWVVYASAGMLKGKVERYDPRIGDRVGVAFLGRADDEDSTSPQRWNLKVIERAEQPAPSEPLAGSTESRVELATRDDVGSGGNDDDIPF